MAGWQWCAAKVSQQLATGDLGILVHYVTILTYVIIVKIELPMWALYGYSNNKQSIRTLRTMALRVDLGELLTVTYIIAMHLRSYA